MVTGKPDMETTKQKNIEEYKSQLQMGVERYKASAQMDVEKYKASVQVQVEQYRSLRNEIMEYIKGMNQTQLFSIIGVALYYGWAFAHCVAYNTRFMYILTWLVPILIQIFGIWRNLEYYRTMKCIADYISKIEKEFEQVGYPIGPETGWETHMQDFLERGEVAAMPRVFLFFWITLVLAIFAIAGVEMLWQYPGCRGSIGFAMHGLSA
jgi:hypothetical protein